MSLEVRDHATKVRCLDISLCYRVLAELALSAMSRPPVAVSNRFVAIKSGHCETLTFVTSIIFSGVNDTVA